MPRKQLSQRGRRGRAPLWALSCITAGSLSAQSFETDSAAKVLPNYNILATRARVVASKAAASANLSFLQQSKQLRSGSIRFDDQFGLPTFLLAGSENHPVSTTKAWASQRPEEAAAREHLNRLASLYALSPRDVTEAQTANVHNTGKGAIIVKFRQRLNGVDVFRDEMSVVMNRKLDLVAISGYLKGSGSGKLGSAAESLRAEAGTASYALSEQEALSQALLDLSGVKVDPAAWEALTSRDPLANYRIQAGAASNLSIALRSVVRAKPVYFHLPEGLQAAYYIELDVRDKDTGLCSCFSYVLSAADGSLLFRNNLQSDDAMTYRVWASGSHVPLPGPHDPSIYFPYTATGPDGVVQPFIASSLHTLQNGPISTNDPWLTAGATETNGNNVDAYVDLDGTDGFTGSDFRATVSTPAAFDYTYDHSLAPNANSTQQLAVITQLFYTNNWLHDWYYDAGFDEASGNAQASNYGRGGVEGDAIHAEAQDFGGTNNANMATPSDGAHPRMQMYVFSGPSTRSLTLAPGGALATGTCAFGPQIFNVTANVVLANDGVGTASDACTSISNNVAGAIALIDRGTCPFATKVKNAQDAGAVGVIVANNAASVINMGGTDATITIPALSVSQADGATIKAALSGGAVSVTLAQSIQPNLDGALDTQVVAHEWGHYISHRLIANSTGLNSNQSNGMGEGWGDFHALLMSLQDGTVNLDGAFSMGGYACRGIVPNNSYYFGIRRFPYSTDFTKNPLTFKHIMDGVALPTTAPINANGSVNSEVHNAGEVWAAMLWEAYAALLKDTQGGSPRLTFSLAQDRMKRYLVAAYKITPSDPTFLEARDALLTVASAEDPLDAQLFIQAFARRGAGIGAVAPDRYSANNAGVVESYTSGGVLALESVTLSDAASNCSLDGDITNNEVGVLSITLRNEGGRNLNSTTASVTSSNPHIKFLWGNQISFPASSISGSTTASARFALKGATGIEAADFSIAYNDNDLAVPGPLTSTASFAVNRQAIPLSSKTEDAESALSAWTVDSLGSQSWKKITDAALDHHWHGPDAGTPGSLNLTSPVLDVSATDPLTLSFKHRYAFEFDGGGYYDGGVIEISTDGGTSWNDISAHATPAYTQTLLVYSGNLNPLAGRQAYAGQSAGYPAYATETVNLGTSYAGQQVKVRFRCGSDNGSAATGWDLDDIAFTGIDNTPFPTSAPGVDCALVLGVNSNSLSFLAAGESKTDVLTSNVTWTATSDSVWLGVSPGAGSGNGTLTLTAQANTGAARKANVTLQGEGLTRTLTVNQATTQSAPTISVIPDQSIPLSGSSAALPFTLADADTPLANLTLVVTTDNPILLPLAKITSAGSESSRTLTITPTMGMNGTGLVRVRVTDPQGLTASTLFTVTVGNGNNNPTITAIANQTLTAGVASAAIPFTLGDAETPLANLSLVVTTDTPTLIPLSKVVLGGSGANRTITLTPQAGQSGTAKVRVRVSDPDGGTNSTLFTVTVGIGNHNPTITTIANQTLTAGVASTAIPFTIGDAETPLANLSLVVTTDNPTLIPLSKVVLGGSGANRTITLTPKAGQSGTANVRVRVNDPDGGTNSTLFTVTVASGQNAIPK